MVDVNISLEPHLVDALAPLQSLLPESIASDLSPYLAQPAPPTIPYAILSSVSRWSRTPSAVELLRASNLTLSDYTMLAFLAGTKTSPECKFPPHVAPKEPEQVQAQLVRERKAITTLVNALLSIVGTGLATWWMAERTGWKAEWKALFSLLVALVVAVSEAGLYIIWQARRSPPNSRRTTRRRLASAEHKKHDGDIPTDKTLNQALTAELRHRTAVSRTE